MAMIGRRSGDSHVHDGDDDGLALCLSLTNQYPHPTIAQAPSPPSTGSVPASVHETTNIYNYNKNHYKHYYNDNDNNHTHNNPQRLNAQNSCEEQRILFSTKFNQKTSLEMPQRNTEIADHRHGQICHGHRRQPSNICSGHSKISMNQCPASRENNNNTHYHSSCRDHHHNKYEQHITNSKRTNNNDSSLRSKITINDHHYCLKSARRSSPASTSTSPSSPSPSSSSSSSTTTNTSKRHLDSFALPFSYRLKSSLRIRMSLSTLWLLVILHIILAINLPLIVDAQPNPPTNSSANIRQLEKKILDKIIGIGNYDSRIRPSGNTSVTGASEDGPAMIYVNLLIRSISRIDDVVMEYSVQVTFREQWIDSRLRFNNRDGSIRYLVLTDPNRVWRPDLFFKNEKEGHFHDIIMPNVLLRIYPDGMVLYSIRISLVLACPMDLKYYPLDKQVCSIQMASYGYTTEDLMFVWKETDPVQITTNLHLPRFTLEKYLTAYCTSKTNTGSYSCLKVDLLFKREFSYYLIQIYIPCCMLVIVSWVSFWLDPNAIPARVSLGVTTLLTMATSISGINSSLPPVSYTKAIDVWTGVCLTFVFGALLEFALVNYASRSDAHRAALKQQQAAYAAQRKWDIEHAAALESGEHIDERTASAFAMRPLVRQPGGDNFHNDKMRACEIHVTLPKRNWCKRWLSKFPTRSKRIDVISRIFFPLMFALFNLVYWTTYLFREDMQDFAGFSCRITRANCGSVDGRFRKI